MIISKDINPERDLYYLGAKVLEILFNADDRSYNFFSVYEELKSAENISMNLFTLTLDWLYIIGAINKPENGNIILCF